MIDRNTYLERYPFQAIEAVLAAAVRDAAKRSGWKPVVVELASFAFAVAGDGPDVFAVPRAIRRAAGFSVPEIDAMILETALADAVARITSRQPSAKCLVGVDLTPATLSVCVSAAREQPAA